jgi:type IV fimbrial biogenesis protein FimT
MFWIKQWQSRRRQPKRHPGYSGVELLAAIASAFFLALLGTPIFNLFIDRGPQHLLQEPLLASHLEYARQEAMREAVTVTVCPSQDGRNCLTDSDWHMGWLIFIDSVNPPNHLSVGDTLLYRQQGYMGNQAMVASASLIQYQPDGSINLN